MREVVNIQKKYYFISFSVSWIRVKYLVFRTENTSAWSLKNVMGWGLKNMLYPSGNKQANYRLPLLYHKHCRYRPLLPLVGWSNSLFPINQQAAATTAIQIKSLPAAQLL